MSVQFAVLASGSRGNSALVQAGGVGILLDVGVGPRILQERLRSVGSAWDKIASAFLTHTHGDHVDNSSLHALARHRARFYCHEGHRAALSQLSGFRALEERDLVRHYDDRPLMTQTGLRVESLELRHDGGPTFGFRVEVKAGRVRRGVELGYLSDTGSWSPEMADALADVDLLGVEFNHDVEMQRRSQRSPYLIARNLGDRGHLSNEQGAELVGAVLARSGPGALRHVVLLHLSEQCNIPCLALQVARDAVRASGRRVSLHAARQVPAHPNLVVEPGRRRARAAG